MKGLIAAAALLGSAFLTAAAAAPEAAVASHDKVAAVMKGDRLSLTTSNSSWATVVRELAAQTGIALRVAPVPAGTVTVALMLGARPTPTSFSGPPTPSRRPTSPSASAGGA